jgi:hypothetical protein
MLRVLPIVIAGLLVSGCEKTNDENIDKWTHTEKGPAKLKKAFSDEGLDASLSAHAAANMIKKGDDPDVRAGFETMSQSRRVEVVAKLAPRLWEMARIENDNALPDAGQVRAKDALLVVRKYADDATKQQIDVYLVDWYGVTSYEARSQVGATLGATVLRMLGPAAGKKLISVVNAVIATPGQDKTKIRIGDELMLGLAVSNNPDAIKYLLDIARMDRGDTTLPTRAMNALNRAFVDPEGLFDVTDPSGLVPNLDHLVDIAKDDKLPGGVANRAVALIRAVGPPKCIEPLVGMVAYPHSDPRFRYVAANSALICGGPVAIKDVVRALPDGTYDKEELVGAVAGPLSKLSPRDQVLAAARELLTDKKPIARWVAMEALATMKSTDDAAKIAALSGDKTTLVGYWGDPRKADPTLGERAKELAAALGAK